MEHTTGKIGTALTAAVLGLGIPVAAAAQEYPTGAQDGTIDTTQVDETTDTSMADVAVIDQAMAGTQDNVSALNSLGRISSADVAVISMNDMNLTAEQRYTIAQNSDPGSAVLLQKALSNVMVGEYGGETPTLAEHLASIGVDPTSVVAVDVANDNTVTLYTQ